MYTLTRFRSHVYVPYNASFLVRDTSVHCECALSAMLAQDQLLGLQLLLKSDIEYELKTIVRNKMLYYTFSERTNNGFLSKRFLCHPNFSFFLKSFLFFVKESGNGKH